MLPFRRLLVNVNSDKMVFGDIMEQLNWVAMIDGWKRVVTHLSMMSQDKHWLSILMSL